MLYLGDLDVTSRLSSMNFRNRPALLASVGVLFVASAHAASVAPVAAEHGMVVTAQERATHVGVEVLKAGGNAIDAAVAVGYALAVVFPSAGNLGGGGFMTIELADGRRSFIDFRERAPLAASANMYLGPDGQVIEDLSTRGYLSAGVPGTVAGLEMALAKYGSMKRAQVIDPAIRLAQDGFVLETPDVRILRSATDDFRADPPSAAIFLHHGEPFAVGDRLVQADLARTLRRIRDGGVDGFYRGPVADAMVAANRQGKGIMTLADFEQYQAKERDPIECDYRGYHVVTAPPPSSGGVVLCEMLNILEGYPLRDLGFHSAQSVHVEIEAMRNAYRDRNTFLGDPDFVANPIDRLLAKEYAREVRARIDPEKAAALPPLPEQVAHEGTNTTHYSIADRFGNAVSVTYTLNDWFGAHVVAAGTGVLLNDEMDDFTSKVGVPNMYGLLQGSANAIAPGKRPLSSMTPTIVSREGKPVLVVGTPGGSRITTVVLQIIVNVIDYGMNIQEAVDAPRFHQQWRPEATEVEEFALSPDTRKLLLAMGHKFAGPQPDNHAAAILIGAPRLSEPPGHVERAHRGGPAQAAEDRFFGANDPRRGIGLALGY
jgi:gamma-glutamyltranspeptidase/glutathione hydrolase